MACVLLNTHAVLNNELLLLITRAVLPPHYVVLNAACITIAKAEEQFLKLLLPPSHLSVTFGYVSVRMSRCFAFAIQKQQEWSSCSSLAEGPCPAAPSLPSSSFIAPPGRADPGRKTAVILLEKAGDPLI